VRGDVHVCSHILLDVKKPLVTNSSPLLKTSILFNMKLNLGNLLYKVGIRLLNEYYVIYCFAMGILLQL